MLKTELAEILRNGENSGVEFKRDHEHPDSVAKEVTALANLEGGSVLLGVEDDGAVTGLTRASKMAEEWVMNLCRQNVQPPFIPFWETVEWEPGKTIGILGVPRDAPDKPYKAKRGTAWVVFVRIGSTSREATREEEARLYQASGMLRYELRPVPGSSLGDLDHRRLRQYFVEVRAQECPEEGDDEGWTRLLLNTELMVDGGAGPIPSVGGMILFGREPYRFVPQTGISAVAYAGTEKDYTTIERPPPLRGPMVRLGSPEQLVDNGLVEQALHFVHRNTATHAALREGTRVEWRDYPDDAVREAVVNALIHRDYTITGTDIELSIYSDRLEVISPGRLPNTITVDRMKAGCRAARNEMLKEVLRDYRYVEATGLGVPRKIVRRMHEHNGTAPDLIEEETRFLVRLWKAGREAAPGLSAAGESGAIED